MPRVHRVTAANGAINSTLDVGDQNHGWQLECVKLHLNDVGGTGSFTITQDAVGGATYDVLHFTQDMTSESDVVWTPDPPIPFLSGDNLIFAYANANNRTYGLEVIWNIRN